MELWIVVAPLVVLAIGAAAGLIAAAGRGRERPIGTPRWAWAVGGALGAVLSTMLGIYVVTQPGGVLLLGAAGVVVALVALRLQASLGPRRRARTTRRRPVRSDSDTGWAWGGSSVVGPLAGGDGPPSGPHHGGPHHGGHTYEGGDISGGHHGGGDFGGAGHAGGGDFGGGGHG